MANTSLAHEFIEASAGTGKTYTIEKRVVDLVVQDGFELDRILVVTFTEKATGELRRRLRAKLETELGANPTGAAAKRLRDGIDRFDEAPISTIHGFCQQMLREYAFLCGQPFSLRLLEDPQAWDRLFARQLRGPWRRSFLNGGDAARCRDAYKNGYYRETVERVAGGLMTGDTLKPPATSSLRDTHEAVAVVVAALLPRFGHSLDNSPFLQQLANHKMHASSKGSVIKHCSELIDCLGRLKGNPHDPTAIEEFLKWEASDACWKHFEAFPEIGLLEAQHIEAMEKLQALGKLLQGAAISHAVASLARAMDRYKRDAGTLEYNDMLQYLEEALKQHPMLLDSMRARYDCALVDEFQDTDAVQWRIFQTVFGHSPRHRLIVVGDPKQAIYSFRGANFHVYQAARDELAAAGVTTLDTNYRTIPLLLEPLNTLFETSWFLGGIPYTLVQAPPGDALLARLHSDKSGRRPLNLVRLPEKVTGARARKVFAEFAAHEIKHLLSCEIEIAHRPDTTAVNNKTDKTLYRRAVNAGDICLLIRTRGELPALQRALRRAKVPFSFSRGERLFNTREALEWRYLLRAINAPDDPRAVMKALLTSFFECPADALESYPGLPETHRVRQLLLGWHLRAERFEWGLLLHAIFTESGVLLRALESPGGERAVTNHQHLAQLLHEQAIRGGGTLTDLIAFLDTACLHAEDENSRLQRLETEEPKVQIITMHAAKGLEFPIVFIAGGFTDGMVSGSYTTYTTENGRTYSFAGDDLSKNKQGEERDEEARRLFYVALTRAQYKVYLPSLEPSQKGGPLATFIAAATETSWPHDRWQGDNCVAYLPITADGRAAPLGDDWQFDPSHEPKAKLWVEDQSTAPFNQSALRVQQIETEWGTRHSRVASFTSLAQHDATQTAAFTRSSPTATYTDDSETSTSTARARPADDEDEIAVPQTDTAGELPHGRATGTLIHEVLEQIDFAAVAAAAGPEALLADGSPTQLVFDAALKRNPLATGDDTSASRSRLAKMVWNTLRTPLPFLGGATASSLAKSTRRHGELEFWLPAPGLVASPPRGLRLEHAYLNGFIDLMFCHDDRYYIVDWKSNWLPDGYAQPALDAAMKASQYDLQYKIYVVALDRMLRAARPDYDPAQHLGGVCYLFLRGLTGMGDGDGIHFVPREHLDVASFQDEIVRRLGSSQ